LGTIDATEIAVLRRKKDEFQFVRAELLLSVADIPARVFVNVVIDDIPFGFKVFSQLGERSGELNRFAVIVCA